MNTSDARIYSIDDERAARQTAQPRERCQELTADGRPCRNYAVADGRCRVHAVTAAQAEAEPEPDSDAPVDGEGRPAGGIDLFDGLRAVLGDDLQQYLDRIAEFIRIRLSGEYEVDEFGFDRHLTEQAFLPLLRPLYRRYWRVRSIGIERVPRDGALLVANHAGTFPLDALMVKIGLYDEAGIHMRELGADLVWKLPFSGTYGRKFGATMARVEDATRLLEAGHLVGVWPEGFKGIGKPYKDRYKLQRFGRGGFVEVALRTQKPIVPVAIVGSEEIYPLLYNVKTLARLLGVPYFPITPTFPWLGLAGMIPLPSKWVIEYGEPIDTREYGADAAEDPMVVFDLTDRIRDTIQQMLNHNLMGRRSVFF